MNLRVTPGSPLVGEIGDAPDLSLPGDKSLSHRAALFAALAEGESHIENFQVSGVTRPMLAALAALGIPWELQDATLRIQGFGLQGLKPPAGFIDCGNSATTLRLLAGALAAAGIPAVLDGSPGLRSRPMGRIVAPLQQMGVPIEAAAGDTAPLRLSARLRGERLKPLDYTLPQASAQVKSCLLLAALAADGVTILREPVPSRDHTERMLRAMGVSVIQTDDNTVSLTPPSPARLLPLQVKLPGDFSAAAFLIVAALVTPGSSLVLRGVGLNPGRTGLLDALVSMGADIQVCPLAEQGGEPLGEIRVRYSRLHGAQVSGSLGVRMIDEFPALAIAAAYAQGRTVVKDVAELRYKESDRISALRQQLHRLGVQMDEQPDGFSILGGQSIQAGSVEPAGDHRLAMALAVAGLAAAGPVEVRQADVIAESFPQFVTVLKGLGGRVECLP